MRGVLVVFPPLPCLMEDIWVMNANVCVLFLVVDSKISLPRNLNRYHPVSAHIVPTRLDGCYLSLACS